MRTACVRIHRHGGPEVLVHAAAGYEALVDASAEDFVARANAWTGGRGVDVVLGGTGKAGFLRSPGCVRPMGMAVSCGTASGDVGAFDLQLLHRKPILVTRVDDDGPGGAAPPGCGIGLRNTASRLATLYGEDGRCTAGPRPGGGFRVKLVLPAHFAPGKD